MTTSFDMSEAKRIVRLLREALVISFTFRPAENRFEFTCAPFESAAPEFVRLVFEGVEAFRREVGDLKKYEQFRESYRIDAVQGPILVQSGRDRDFGTRGGSVEFWFGPNFGGLSFQYGNLLAWGRRGTPIKRGTVVNYLDTETGQEFTFCEPFADKA